MNTIEAHAIREDGWWIVTVPIAGKDRATQGKTLKEAEEMVHDLVNIWAEELDDKELAKATINIVATGEAKETVEAVKTAQEAAEAATTAARIAQHSAVSLLRSQGVTMQDIADLMGISKGRVSQLAKTK